MKQLTQMILKLLKEFEREMIVVPLLEKIVLN